MPLSSDAFPLFSSGTIVMHSSVLFLAVSAKHGYFERLHPQVNLILKLCYYRKRSLRVMFSQVSVCPQGGMPLDRGVSTSGSRGVCLRVQQGVCLWVGRVCPGWVCTHPGHTAPDTTRLDRPFPWTHIPPDTHTPNTVNKRAVRILLECFHIL